MSRDLSEGVRNAVEAYLRAHPGASKTSLASSLGISRQALYGYLQTDKPSLPRAKVLRRLSELTGGIAVDGWRCGPDQFTREGRPAAVPIQQSFPFAAAVKVASKDRAVRAEVHRRGGDELVIAVRLKLG